MRVRYGLESVYAAVSLVVMAAICVAGWVSTGASFGQVEGLLLPLLVPSLVALCCSFVELRNQRIEECIVVTALFSASGCMCSILVLPTFGVIEGMPGDSVLWMLAVSLGFVSFGFNRGITQHVNEQCRQCNDSC